MALNLPDDDTPQLPVIVERAAKALAPVATASQLATLAAGSKHIVEITNAAGRDQAAGARRALISTRTLITKTGKDARDDANKFRNEVIEAERQLIAIIQPEEERLDALVKGWEAAREAEKQAKARAEEQRRAALQRKIDSLGPMLKVPTTSAVISAEMERIAGIVVDDSWEERKEEGEALRQQWLDSLQKHHDDALADETRRAAEAAAAEAERKRLAVERAELDAQRAAQARQRAADEERAAEARREAAAAQRVLDDARRKLEADQKKLDDDRRAEEDRKRREAEEASRKEAEAQRAREAQAERERREAAQRAERRSRAMPTPRDMVEAIATEFSTDNDIVVGWLRLVVWSDIEL